MQIKELYLMNGGMLNMTRDETINILLTIQAAYPNFRVQDKTITVNTWHSLLGRYDYSQVISAVEAYVRSDKSGFAPSVGQVIDKICSIYENNDVNEIAAWGMVLKALRNSAYHAEEEFEKLPPAIQRTVSSPGQLKEWATMENLDGTGLNVIQSNFMRTYRLEAERQKEKMRMNPEHLKKLGQNENSSKRISVSEERIEAEKNAVQMPERAREKLQSIFYNRT